MKSVLFEISIDVKEPVWNYMCINVPKHGRIHRFTNKVWLNNWRRIGEHIFRKMI